MNEGPVGKAALSLPPPLPAPSLLLLGQESPRSLLDPVHALLQPLSSAWYQSQLSICEVSRPPQSGVGRLEEPGCLHHSQSLSAAHICQEGRPSGKRLPSLHPGSRGGTLPYYSCLLHNTLLYTHWGSTQRLLSSATPPALLIPPPLHWPSETSQRLSLHADAPMSQGTSR